MSEEFKEGDTVQLKSGGPDMTYVGDDERDEAMCIWFENNKKMEGTFPKVALKKAAPKTGSTRIVRS